MNTNNTDLTDKEIEIPLFIRASLILITSAINLPILFSGLSLESITTFLLFVGKNIFLIPGLFVVVGMLLRLRDDTFKLSNAYYLGVLMAIVLSVQGINGS